MQIADDLERRMIGAQIGGYQITKLIGRGGMGAVFLAENKSIDKQAAVKVMLPVFGSEAARSKATERFRAEAQALAKVKHSGLVQIYDAGVLEDGTFYIEMEYLVGESLREHLAHDQKLPPRLAVSLGLQLTAALQAVHAQGIVHRDLKPGNVFLVADPEAEEGVRAKLLDFGLAQVEKWAEPGEASTQGSGLLVGTARYMSPEQCEQTPSVGGQTDVYALGLILFESLTGESPYPLRDAEPLAWLYAHAGKRPRRLRELWPQAPADLDNLIAEMLDKLPLQRPAPAQVARRLRSYLDGQHGRAAWRKATKRGSLAALGLGLGVLCWRAEPAVVSNVERLSARLGLSHKMDRAAAAAQAPTGMVPIPGATFPMGSTPDEAEAAYAQCQKYAPDISHEIFERESRRRIVTVSDFYLDRTEVTNEAYVTWLNKPLHTLRLERGRYVYDNDTLLLDLHPDGSGIESRENKYVVRAGFGKKPVVQVTWHGADQYCRSLGKQLPTEAEWELAARGLGVKPNTAPTPFPWGWQLPSCEQVAMARDTGQLCERLGPGPLDVGTAPGDVTPHGVYDLGGNVNEWVFDLFVVPYPDCRDCVNPVVVDPIARAGAGKDPSFRVYRGGSWLQNPMLTRSAARGRFREDKSTTGLGFRCATSLSK